MKPAAPLTLALLLLAACARDEDASVRPVEINEDVGQVGTNQQEDLEPALGAWRRALVQDQPALEFGPMGTTALITLSCGADRGLVLDRPGPSVPGSSPHVVVGVGGQQRQLALAAVSGTIPVQRATIAAGDALIGQLGGSQGPIQLRFGDGTPLVLPASPLIGQFAAACRTGEHPPITAAAEEGNEQAEAEAAPAANASNGAATR